MLPNHTATDVLRIINDTKPSILERYFSGRANLSLPVPVSSDEAPMTVGEFLNASAALGAPGCSIMPRLSLYEWLDKQDTLLETAKQLRALNLHPRMTVLGLDNWGNFASDPRVNKSVVTKLFGALHAMGWETLSINTVGGLHQGAYSLASMADFGTVTSSTPPGAVGAVPNWVQLDQLRADPSIATALLYIDFAPQMHSFMNGSTPDEMAAAIVDSLADNEQQRRRNYSFVYPVVQSFWDSTALYTERGGRFAGRSVYNVMCENMKAAAADRPAEHRPRCALYGPRAAQAAL